jgi:hypothetical protein
MMLCWRPPRYPQTGVSSTSTFPRFRSCSFINSFDSSQQQHHHRWSALQRDPAALKLIRVFYNVRLLLSSRLLCKDLLCECTPAVAERETILTPYLEISQNRLFSELYMNLKQIISSFGLPNLSLVLTLAVDFAYVVVLQACKKRIHILVASFPNSASSHALTSTS